MNNQILLSVKDLHMWFELRKWVFARAGFVHAVDGASFELKRGEALALVGESGSGKTTLAKTILGLHNPTKGEILFEGRILNGLGGRKMRWFRSEVGYIQQDPYGALPPFMSVNRILKEPLYINKVDNKNEWGARIHEVLKEVKLTPVKEFLPKFPHMLSGGQQQRLVIARAMIMRPKFIAADEPVSMLDASVRVEILQLLRKLQEAHNLAITYITHDLSTVRYFSKRIFIMYAAKIVEKAEASELLQNPLHPYTQALLEAIPDPVPENAAKFRKVPPGEPPSLLNPSEGCRFQPRCPRAIGDLCDKRQPPAFEPTPEHFVECWLYQNEVEK